MVPSWSYKKESLRALIRTLISGPLLIIREQFIEDLIRTFTYESTLACNDIPDVPIGGTFHFGSFTVALQLYKEDAGNLRRTLPYGFLLDAWERSI